MDMVCVSENPHDWSLEWVTIIEENGVLRGNATTLGADNGIGVAAMMAAAELEKRPTLELLFTMGEEIGLIGAHHIDIPLTAPYALNLDWCHSETIGIGCGGTLLMEWSYEMGKIEEPINSETYELHVTGMRGGHSGVDILDTRWNALVELSKIITERTEIISVSEIHGGDADNAIPRSAKAIIQIQGDEKALMGWMTEKAQSLQTITKTDTLSISLKKIENRKNIYDKNILQKFSFIESGVQIWSDDWHTPLSSWNLGKMKLIDWTLTWCYFLRTNIVGGIEPMREKIVSAFNSVSWVNFELSHEWPVWLADAHSPFVQWILTSIKSYNGKSIPAITMHATMEAGTLAEKFPETQWVSIGASCHDMHTTREHIYLADLEEFCGRFEKIIQSYNA